MYNEHHTPLIKSVTNHDNYIRFISNDVNLHFCMHILFEPYICYYRYVIDYIVTGTIVPNPAFTLSTIIMSCDICWCFDI